MEKDSIAVNVENYAKISIVLLILKMVKSGALFVTQNAKRKKKMQNGAIQKEDGIKNFEVFKIKLNVKIYQDKEFTDRVKELILNQVNELLKEKLDFRKMVEQIVDKYIKRGIVKQLVDAKIQDIIKSFEFQGSSYYRKSTYSEYVKDKTNKILEDLVKKVFEQYIVEIKKK